MLYPKRNHYVTLPPAVVVEISKIRRAMNRKGHSTKHILFLYRNPSSSTFISYGAYINLGLGVRCSKCGRTLWLGEGTRNLVYCTKPVV